MLTEASASLRSFRATQGNDEPPGPGRNVERGFHGQKRRNDAHASTTDSDAKLGRENSNTAAKLCVIGQPRTKNRDCVIVEADATKASNSAERGAAIAIIEQCDPRSGRQLTLAADKCCETRGSAAARRVMDVTPHVADKARHSGIDGKYEAACGLRRQPA